MIEKAGLDQSVNSMGSRHDACGSVWSSLNCSCTVKLIKEIRCCLYTERSDTCVHFVDMLPPNCFFFLFWQQRQKKLLNREN